MNIFSRLFRLALLPAIIVGILAACSAPEEAPETIAAPSQEATAVPEPTSAPAEPTPVPEPTSTPAEPTAEAEVEPPAAEVETEPFDSTMLIGNPWQWDAFTSPVDGESPIANPQLYLLIFVDETTALISADCNFASASYSVDGSQITIEPGPVTLAECGPESQSQQFLDYLSRTASISAADGTLLIDLLDDAGTMQFSVNDPQAALRVESWDEAAQKTLESCGMPGAVMLVDSPEGRFLQAYGLASIEDNTPMQTGDRFEIGSNTKSFTVVLALQLQEEGVWSLDDPLSQWLPDEAARIPNGDAITLRQLAANTSGVWDYADPLISAALSEGNLAKAYTPEELVDYIVENGEPSFAPGEGAEYSSSNYLLLGLAIEAATSESIANLYQERIFDPLGMENSSLLEGVPEENAIVNGYYTDENGQTTNTTEQNGSQMWAAGGIISTAEDLTKYSEALLLGSLFQDPASLAQMTDFGDEIVGLFSGYGLGIGKWMDEPLAWGHGGQTAGFQSLFAVFPNNLTSVVLLTNSATCTVAGLMGIIQASPALLPDPFAGMLDSGPTFPLPEPDYTSKRPRDFEPFTAAPASLTPERAAELDGLLTGAAIPGLQGLMDGGQLSSEELVTYYVNRIQQIDVDKLNSVMELNPEALAIAQALDDEREAGSTRGSMHGIPVLLKDNIATGDQMHTTAGAYALKDWQADRDAFLVQQLRQAGAVILGKANLSEWANYMDPNMPSGFSTLGGQTRHPYGPFDPLGSSTGSAVAAAANLTTVSVGTETQGSVIQPAISNGLVGIKTSRGLVSRDYIVPLANWMDVPGPMGRSVTDVAILLTAMTGVDENDAATSAAADLAGTDFSQFAAPNTAQGKKVGIFISSDEMIESFITDFEVTEDAAETLRQNFQAQNEAERQIGAVLAGLGMEVVEIDGREAPGTPDVEQMLEYGFQDSVNQFLGSLDSPAPVATLAEVAAINDEDPANRAPYGQGYITGSVNTAVTAEEYAALVQDNQEMAEADLRAVFDSYSVDAIVSSSQAYAAAGFPAITVPLGLDPSGQPTGVIFIGDFLGEPDLIAIAYAFEQAIQGRVEPDLEATLMQIESLHSSE